MIPPEPKYSDYQNYNDFIGNWNAWFNTKKGMEAQTPTPQDPSVVSKVLEIIDTERSRYKVAVAIAEYITSEKAPRSANPTNPNSELEDLALMMCGVAWQSADSKAPLTFKKIFIEEVSALLSSERQRLLNAFEKILLRCPNCDGNGKVDCDNPTRTREQNRLADDCENCQWIRTAITALREEKHEDSKQL